MESYDSLIVALGIVVVAVIVLVKTAIVVPQQNAFVVERLGKYAKTLSAGFHILIPFIEKVAYKHTLKEQAADIDEQICITKDNVQVGVDGVLYLQVLDPARASYGIGDYMFAISQLAQTTLRSEIGKIDLDRTFEERGMINANVVVELDKASDPWGVKVLRYEIKNINPPQDVLGAMEKQMRAEREKRAVILESEGRRQSAINVAEGEKQSKVLAAEADRAEQILQAEGEAKAIEMVAEARANALRAVGEAAATEKGQKAVQLDLATRAIAARDAGLLAEEIVPVVSESFEVAGMGTRCIRLPRGVEAVSSSRWPIMPRSPLRCGC